MRHARQQAEEQAANHQNDRVRRSKPLGKKREYHDKNQKKNQNRFEVLNVASVHIRREQYDILVACSSHALRIIECEPLQFTRLNSAKPFDPAAESLSLLNRSTLRFCFETIGNSQSKAPVNSETMTDWLSWARLGAVTGVERRLRLVDLI
jgi:hypothetical protein